MRLASFPIAAVRARAVRLGAGVLGDIALTAVCYRLQLNLATVSLLFLLNVVIQSLSASFYSAVLAALIAGGFLDYFFVAPVLAWGIADPFDVVAIVVFITTAVLIARLAARAFEAAARAERRRQSLEQIYQCSERILILDPGDNFIGPVLRIYREIFRLRAICFFDGRTAEVYEEGPSGGLRERTRLAYIAGTNDDSTVTAPVLCIRSRGRVIAALGFEGLRDAESAIRAIEAITVAALDRERAFRSASLAIAERRTEALRAAVLDALAHELKTPLASILTAAGALREIAGDTAQEELSAGIEAEALRITELTSGLLRRAEMESSKVRAQMEETDLIPLVESLVDRFARQHPDRRIELCEPEQTVSPLIADSELIQLALGQLLENAVKYSRPDTMVRVKVTTDDLCAHVIVWNGGSSIVPRDRDRIFDRFYRGATTEKKIAGSGLGLHIAKKIVLAHHGALVLEPDSPEEGVAFRMSLPIPAKEKDDAEITDQLVGSR